MLVLVISCQTDEPPQHVDASIDTWSLFTLVTSPSCSLSRRKHHMQSLQLPPSEVPTDINPPHRRKSHPLCPRPRINTDSSIQVATRVYTYNASTDATFDWAQDADNTLPVMPAVAHHPPLDFSSLRPSGASPWPTCLRREENEHDETPGQKAMKERESRMPVEALGMIRGAKAVAKVLETMG
ncbi:hypothetical protein OG21DRAFT_1528023 [Imleria badia]|nr:hypothetical protein OG21DRAFT_1528023 [Imleria badia]